MVRSLICWLATWLMRAYLNISPAEVPRLRTQLEEIREQREAWRIRAIEAESWREVALSRLNELRQTHARASAEAGKYRIALGKIVESRSYGRAVLLAKEALHDRPFDDASA
jgi:hypothetical protein